MIKKKQNKNQTKFESTKDMIYCQLKHHFFIDTVLAWFCSTKEWSIKRKKQLQNNTITSWTQMFRFLSRMCHYVTNLTSLSRKRVVSTTSNIPSKLIQDCWGFDCVCVTMSKQSSIIELD